MAVTWIKPLKLNKGKSVFQTLTDRTDYIENPDKTIKGELIKGYACDPRSVDEEFYLAKKEYEHLSKRGEYKKNVLAYHIRQSFKPGEITPQEAQDVGYELAMRFTKGKHAFIVAVHTDRKHIHCHIVFNSTTIDYTGKFNNFFRSSFAIRRLSDLICVEHGLSIIENPKPSKGKNYAKWLGDKPPSWQEKLRMKIDEVLPDCSTFENFISTMKKAGYTVKDNRKYISFCAPGQKRPTRLKSLGEYYSDAAIRERLGMTRTVVSSSMSGSHTRVNLLIDIQEKIREGKGAGYERWARIFNLKESARTLLFLKENGIDSYDDLVKKASTASGNFSALTKKIKEAEKRMTEISELQKHIGTYGKTREVYAKYKASGWNDNFYEEHRADIVLHRAAKKYFDGLGIKKLPTITSLKQEYAALIVEKKKLYSGYHAAKDNMQKLLVAKGNAQQILGIKPEPQEHTVSGIFKRGNSHEI